MYVNASIRPVYTLKYMYIKTSRVRHTVLIYERHDFYTSCIHVSYMYVKGSIRHVYTFNICTSGLLFIQ